MAVQLLESLATDFLENQYFLGLYRVVKHCGFHDCALYVRGSDFHCTLVIEKQHLVELYRLVFLGSKAVYENLRTSLNLELLSCNVNNCVHFNKTIKFPAASARLLVAELERACQSSDYLELQI